MEVIARKGQLLHYRQDITGRSAELAVFVILDAQTVSERIGSQRAGHKQRAILTFDQ